MLSYLDRIVSLTAAASMPYQFNSIATSAVCLPGHCDAVLFISVCTFHSVMYKDTTFPLFLSFSSKLSLTVGVRTDQR